MSESVTQIAEALHRMSEARERVTANRTTDAIINTIAQVSRGWLTPANAYRQRAIDEAPAMTGFSPEMVAEAIDLTFRGITVESLGELLDRELGNRRVLDEFCLHGRFRSQATGPRLITHFLAGNIPAPGIVSICLGLLLRAANLVKVSARDPLFPWMFIESIRDVDAELAELATALWWAHEDVEATKLALTSANAVIAYGDDSTVDALREQTPSGTAFLGYGHKLSFGVIAREALTVENLPALARAAAFDVSVYDQQGCLSPHMLFVEEGGQAGPRKFAHALAEAMAEYQERVPRGPLSVEEAGRLASLRTGYEFRAQTDRRVAVWTSENPNEWAVIYEDEPKFTPSCLNRLIFVKPTDGYKRVLSAVQRFAPSISCVGLAPLHERAIGFAAELAKLGIHRICHLGQMQNPPLSWHHDGRRNVADLVRWTDIG